MGACCSSENNPPANGAKTDPPTEGGHKVKIQPPATGPSSSEAGDVDAGSAVLIGLLADVPLLSKLKKAEQRKLAKLLQQREYNKGEDLMTQGDVGDEFFIIFAGTCDVVVTTDGKEEIVAELGKGDYCGEQALLSATKRNATIRANCMVDTLVLSREGFESILKDSKVRFAKREAKRRAIAMENLENFQIDSSKDTNKTPEEVEWLLECIHDNLLFENLNIDQQRVLVKHMYKETIKKDEDLITQGEKGDTFYVIEEGDFDISVTGVGSVETLKRGGCTGDLALMYNAPRAATVKALTDGKVWVMERATFRKALMDHNKTQTHQNIEFLKRVELLQPLLSSELALVDQALVEKTFKSGAALFTQGDIGENFYILMRGTCHGTIKDEEGNIKEEFDYKSGDFFGERALQTKEPRAATITCTSDNTMCLVLPEKEFRELLGPLEDIMNRNIEEYNKPADQRDVFGRESGSPDDDICGLDEFTSIGVLGKGAFGTVSLVVDPNTKKSYALKAIRKIQIVELGQQTHITNEKSVMQMLNSKFLVNLRGTFKDTWRIYFLLDVCLGGELFTVLRKMRSFDEPTARFFAACVVEAFSYMHSLNVIYRDLKPENLVLDDTGYLKVTDFGFAKVVVNKTFTLCGTPDYLAPEIVTGQGHGKGVDWWTLGVLIYEMIASFPPFFDDEPMMTYRKIISCKFKFPKYLSPTSKDIITRLLKPRPTKRLGVLKGGAKLLREHMWFSNFAWEKLVDGSMTPPIQPSVKSPDDISNFEKFEQEEEEFKFDVNRVDMSWDKEF